MTNRSRRNHAPAFKAKVAIAAIKSEKTLAKLEKKFDGHPNQIAAWKGHLLDAASGLFDPSSGPAEPAPMIDVKTLHAKIGELTLENDLYPVRSARPAERKATIDRMHELPLGRQAELLRSSRSSVYYEPKPVPEGELAIMRRIDALHLDYLCRGCAIC